MEPAGLAYSVTAIVLATVLIRLTRTDALACLARWRPHPRMVRFVGGVAAALLVIGLLDELGLLLQEWDLPAGPLGKLRWLEGLPGSSQLLYVANLILLVPATLEVLKEQAPIERGPFRSGPEFNVALALQLVSLTFLLTSIQVLVWEETGPWPGGLVAACIVIASFAVSTAICASAGGRLQQGAETGLEPRDRLQSRDIHLILLGTVLLQTMITKAGLLLVLIPRGRKAILRLLARLRPNMIAGRAGSAPADLPSLARRLRQGDTIHRFGFYLLLTSGFPALFFWQSHASAYAPVDSAFPRTMSINLCYTVDMLLMAFALIRGNPRGILAASIALVMSRHMLYALFPSWFLPSLVPPGYSPVHALSVMFGTLSAVPVISVGMHFCVLAVYWTASERLLSTQEAIDGHGLHWLGRAFRWSVLGETAGCVVNLFLTGLLVWIVVAIDSHHPTANRVAIHAVCAGGILVFCGQQLFGTVIGYSHGRSAPDLLSSDIRRLWGQDGVVRLLALSPLAGYFGRDRVHRSFDRLWLLHGGVAVVQLVAAGLVAVTG